MFFKNFIFILPFNRCNLSITLSSDELAIFIYISLNLVLA